MRFCPLEPRRHVPIILTITERCCMDDDLMLRIDQGLAIVPLNDPMGGLHVRRVVIRDMTLQLLAPFARFGSFSSKNFSMRAACFSMR